MSRHLYWKKKTYIEYVIRYLLYKNLFGLNVDPQKHNWMEGTLPWHYFWFLRKVKFLEMPVEIIVMAKFQHHMFTEFPINVVSSVNSHRPELLVMKLIYFDRLIVIMGGNKSMRIHFETCELLNQWRSIVKVIFFYLGLNINNFWVFKDKFRCGEVL